MPLWPFKAFRRWRKYESTVDSEKSLENETPKPFRAANEESHKSLAKDSSDSCAAVLCKQANVNLSVPPRNSRPVKPKHVADSSTALLEERVHASDARAQELRTAVALLSNRHMAVLRDTAAMRKQCQQLQKRRRDLQEKLNILEMNVSQQAEAGEIVSGWYMAYMLDQEASNGKSTKKREILNEKPEVYASVGKP